MIWTPTFWELEAKTVVFMSVISLAGYEVDRVWLVRLGISCCFSNGSNANGDPTSCRREGKKHSSWRGRDKERVTFIPTQRDGIGGLASRQSFRASIGSAVEIDDRRNTRYVSCLDSNVL